ncbi:biotin/lipoate--protein ligase family protein [Methylorubrum salsuginis]|uniref:Biotin-(Acetyl-CoA carboxylase) ligase n=1 Tax=Methylorubrum salsuginis TaxID=414703 RepID=A0A1I4FS89_9HYPH|nr:biotin/lipoate--protein ligase family protein [Methylorubrum salsuginis]SFL19541.1 Biotin-(acetyl-CoA carboxylase) ligase [Methylorubrum salsuginis]
MTQLSEARPADLVLPPAFTGLLAASAVDAHDEACRLAQEGAEAGTLLLAESGGTLSLAVVLAPDEPLGGARRALFAGMWALIEAIGGFGPPEIPVVVSWPDTLHFNEARLAGGRLGWPEGCTDEAVPDWLVFSASLIASKRHAGDPGLTPDSTSLEEEGFPADLARPLAESFARFLTKAFEIWTEDGFQHLAGRYLDHLALPPQAREAQIVDDGSLRLTFAPGVTEDRPLRPALVQPAWRDPETGTVRL